MSPERASLFRYAGLEVGEDRLVGRYELDGREFCEAVTFDGVGDLRPDGVQSIARTWYMLAGLSYYKLGAAQRVQIDGSDAELALLRAAIVDGLGEFAYRNDIDLTDVALDSHPDRAIGERVDVDPTRVLTPFGGGIDSVVTVESVALDQALFIVSPAAGRFAALETT
ncbi:MAG TPA: hypothetical protein VGS61_08070, partial [Acidimicrobiales bacterium]|nr:hypothetical protein [Acidimicrobiales bacterium]